MSRNTWPALLAVGLLFSGLAAAPPRQEATPTPTAEATELAPTAPPATEEATEATSTNAQFPPVWISPTPDETGAIVVIVQPGESLWVIAARAGLSLPDLLTLNSLTEQSIINPGDALVVGYATPQAAAVEGTSTAAPPPPTPRPTDTPAESAVCLAAFDDLNRDGAQDADEPLRAGVAFTIYNTEVVVANYVTDGRSEPKCLRGLTPGEYRVTRSITPGEVLTTEGDWALSLTAGSELHQSFGSFIGATTPTADGRPTTAAFPAAPTPLGSPAPLPPPSPAESLAPRLFGVIALFLGGLLLLGAVLLLILRQSRTRPLNDQPSETMAGERRFRNIDDLE